MISSNSSEDNFWVQFSLWRDVVWGASYMVVSRKPSTQNWWQILFRLNLWIRIRSRITIWSIQIRQRMLRKTWIQGSRCDWKKLLLSDWFRYSQLLPLTVVLNKLMRCKSTRRKAKLQTLPMSYLSYLRCSLLKSSQILKAFCVLEPRRKQIFLFGSQQVITFRLRAPLLDRLY